MRGPDRPHKNRDVAFPEPAEMMIETVPRVGLEPTRDTNEAGSVEKRGSLLELALNLGAKRFRGSANPADAEEWMRQMEKIFSALGCSGEQKIRVTRFMQEGPAHDWWASIERRFIDPSTVTWEEFRLEFFEKYIPRSYLEAKLKEFLLLQQGAASVAEYENEFYALSRYGPSFVADEIMMCGRFEAGLRRDIRTIVTAVGWREFHGLVEAAKRVEQCISGQWLTGPN